VCVLEWQWAIVIQGNLTRKYYGFIGSREIPLAKNIHMSNLTSKIIVGAVYPRIDRLMS